MKTEREIRELQRKHVEDMASRAKDRREPATGEPDGEAGAPKEEAEHAEERQEGVPAEALAWLFQHDETGRMVFCPNDGVNTVESFAAANPRLIYVAALGRLATHPAPAQQAAPQAETPEAKLLDGWKLNHVQFERGSGKAEIGYLDDEDDRFSPIVTVDTGLYYRPDDAVPLARAILSALVERAPQATAGVAPTLTDEQIELAAKAIFEHWAFAAPVAWVDGGNSDMQDRARRFARAALAATRAEPAGGRDEREEFERWARGKGFAAQRTLPTDAVYSDSSSHIMWEAWQARASLAAPPQPTSEASRDL